MWSYLRRFGQMVRRALGRQDRACRERERMHDELERATALVRSVRDSGFAVPYSSIVLFGPGADIFSALLLALFDPQVIHCWSGPRAHHEQEFRKRIDVLWRERYRVAQELKCSPMQIDARIRDAALTPIDEILHGLHIRRHAVPPSGPLSMRSGSADLVVSCDALEHLDEPTVTRLVQESERLLKPRGTMIHSVDTSDPTAREKAGVSSVHFLRWNDTVWRILSRGNGRYHNRLRAYDYESHFRQAGFFIPCLFSTIDNDGVKALETLALCKKYAGHDPQELAVTSARFVCRKSGKYPEQ